MIEQITKRAIGPRSGTSRLCAGIAALAAAGFAALFLRRLYSPGNLEDGLHDEYYGLWLLSERLHALDIPSLHGAGSLSLGFYHGFVLRYLFAALFLAFGPNWTVIRLVPLFFALATLVFLYLLVRDVFDDRTAALASVLVALHPTFRLGTMIGSTDSSNMQFFWVAPLYFLHSYRSTSRGGFLAAAACLAGLGLSTRLHYVWFLLALAAIACAVPGLLTPPRVPPARNLARTALWGLGGFFVGSGGAIAGEVASGWPSVYKTLGLLATPGHPYGFSGYFRNLRDILREWNGLLSGGFFMDKIFHSGPWNAWYPPVFWGAAAGGLAIALVRRDHFWKGFAFFAALVGLVLLQAPLGSTHLMGGLQLFFIYPAPAVIIAAAAVGAFDRARRRWLRAALLAGMAAVLAGEARCALAVGRLFAEKRQAGNFSDAVYDLADWLKRNNPARLSVLTVEEGTTLRSLILLGGEGAPRVANLNYLAKDTSAREIDAALDRQFEREAAGFFAVRYASESLKLTNAAFNRLAESARRRGWNFVPVNEVRDGTGAVVYRVFAATPPVGAAPKSR